MPIADEFFHPKMPLPYRQFLSELWDELRRGRNKSWSNIAPEENDPCDFLEHIAGCQAVVAVAKKAYSTNAGPDIIKSITKRAIQLPNDIAFKGLLPDAIQANYIRNIISAASSLEAVLSEDKKHIYPLARSEAKADVASAPIAIQSSYDDATGITSQSLQNVSISLFTLGRILENISTPLHEKLRTIESRIGSRHTSDQLLVFELDDTLQPFSGDFSGNVGSLRRNALVAAFYAALSNPHPEHATTQRRVNEMLRNRKKLPIPTPQGPSVV